MSRQHLNYDWIIPSGCLKYKKNIDEEADEAWAIWENKIDPFGFHSIGRKTSMAEVNAPSKEPDPKSDVEQAN